LGLTKKLNQGTQPNREGASKAALRTAHAKRLRLNRVRLGARLDTRRRSPKKCADSGNLYSRAHFDWGAV